MDLGGVTFDDLFDFSPADSSLVIGGDSEELDKSTEQCNQQNQDGSFLIDQLQPPMQTRQDMSVASLSQPGLLHPHQDLSPSQYTTHDMLQSAQMSRQELSQSQLLQLQQACNQLSQECSQGYGTDQSASVRVSVVKSGSKCSQQQGTSNPGLNPEEGSSILKQLWEELPSSESGNQNGGFIKREVEIPQSARRRDSGSSGSRSGKKSKPNSYGALGTSPGESWVKLERSRQSARECRARKKLRYQYLDEMICERERANFHLREELNKYVNWCRELDHGRIPDGWQSFIHQGKIKVESEEAAAV